MMLPEDYEVRVKKGAWERWKRQDGAVQALLFKAQRRRQMEEARARDGRYHPFFANSGHAEEIKRRREEAAILGAQLDWERQRMEIEQRERRRREEAERVRREERIRQLKAEELKRRQKEIEEMKRRQEEIEERERWSRAERKAYEARQKRAEDSDRERHRNKTHGARQTNDPPPRRPNPSGHRHSERAEIIRRMWADHQTFWDRLPDNRQWLRFRDIPWPAYPPPSSIADITPSAVSNFLFSSQHSEGVSKNSRLRQALLRWHSDKVESQWLNQVREKDRDKVREAVAAVARSLIQLKQQI